jgi:ABC-2 type transport system permease protein
MTTQSNAVPGTQVSAPAIAPEVMSATRLMYWSLRRELWENRSIYVAPLAVAAVFLFGFLISMIGLPRKMRGLSALDPAHQRNAVAMPYELAAGLIMATALVVAVFYCLDALHGERRDRSILFWKSLPVSDLTTVLSKAVIPLVLPLFAFAITVATQLIMLLLSSAVLLGSGLSVSTLWTQLSLFPMSLMLLYHLLTAHVLWHAPFYGWLLMVSAWARRMAFLWAVIPPLAICVVEKIAFNSSHFANMLVNRLTGPEVFEFPMQGMDPFMSHSLGNFLIRPGLWIGLAVTAAFLAAAVRLRRYRGPI